MISIPDAEAQQINPNLFGSAENTSTNNQLEDLMCCILPSVYTVHV